MEPLVRTAIVAACLLAAAAAGLHAQGRVRISGHLADATSGAPIAGAAIDILEPGLQAVTDSTGRFDFAAVPAGAWLLRVRHLAYGERTDSLRVRGDRDVILELRLSERALELEPIEVEAVARPRAAGSRAYLVTRAQIEQVLPRARHVGDVVRTYIPGASVIEARGGLICIEFRGARGGRTSGCNFPMVVVDGIPIPSPAQFFRDTPVEDLERIEFVPASEGAARFGLGASYGALLIETRRSGVSGRRTPVQPPRFAAWDWSVEAERHPWRRTFISSLGGTAAGTALALAALRCFPGTAAAGGRCVADHRKAESLAALALPLAGAVAGARIFGVTETSTGRLVPLAVGTAVPLTLGLAMYVEGVHSDFRGSRRIGGALVLVGTPLVATLIDGIFRRFRQPDRAPAIGASNLPR
jgi:hypothetical protein